MSGFLPFDRSLPDLLPPDLKSWSPSDDMAHFVMAAIERVPMNAFCAPVRPGGKAQYHLCRIKRATYREIGMRFVATVLIN